MGAFDDLIPNAQRAPQRFADLVPSAQTTADIPGGTFADLIPPQAGERIALQPQASITPAGDAAQTDIESGIADPTRAGAAPSKWRWPDDPHEAIASGPLAGYKPRDFPVTPVETAAAAPRPVGWDGNPSGATPREHRALGYTAAPLTEPAQSGTLANPSVASNAPRPGFLERLVDRFRAQESPSQNIMDIISDRTPEIDPATGARVTPEQQRARRLRYEDRTKPYVPEAETLGEGTADMLGMIARETADPLALIAGAYGAGARGVQRFAKLFAAGGIYEGSAGALEQVSDEGAVTRPGEVAVRAAAGAIAAPALDAALRGIAAGIRKGLSLRQQPDADQAAIDAQLTEGVETARELAQEAGVDPQQALSTLTEQVNTPAGTVVRARTETLDTLPGETAPPSQPSPITGEGGKPRGFVPLDEAPPSRSASSGQAQPSPVAGEGAEPAAPRFQTEAQRRAQALGELGLPPELSAKVAAIFPERPDPITGFALPTDRAPSMERAKAFVADNRQAGFYVETDITNLGGLNKRFGHTGADRIYGDITRIYREELEAVGGQAAFFRHGGDEFGAIVVGAQRDAVDTAAARAEQRVLEYAQSQGLMGIPHHKGGAPGTGIYTGVADIDPGKTADDIFSAADKLVEANKVRRNVQRSTPEETGAIPSAGPAGSTTGGVGAADRAGATGPGDQILGGVSQSPQGAKLAELEDLIGRVRSPEIKASLTTLADALRKEARGTEKLTPRERIARARLHDLERDDVILAIRKLGGINVTLESDWAGRLSQLDTKVVGLPSIERRGQGHSLDHLLVRLKELGYLADDAEKHDLEQLLFNAESGAPVYSRNKRDYSALEADGAPRDLEAEFGARPAGELITLADLQRASADAPPPEAPVFGRRAEDTVPDREPGLDDEFDPPPGVREEQVPVSTSSQTATPEFKRWFGSSKIVNAQGDPLVVYHGTDQDIDAFESARAGARDTYGSAGTGLFFTTNPNLASGYSKASREQFLAKHNLKGSGLEPDVNWDEALPGSAAPNVMPVFLNIRNPMRLTGREWNQTQPPEAFRQIKERALAAGHDGIVIDGGEEIVAFIPTQVKSAIGNRGTFDPSDPSIVRETQGALPGLAPRNETAQAVANRQRETTARLRGEGIKLKPRGGPTFDLFGDGNRQTDLTALIKAKPGAVEVAQPATVKADPNALIKSVPGVKHVKVGSLPTGITQINSAADAAHLVAPIRKNAQEHFVAIVTDAEGNVLRAARVHVGDVSSAPANTGTIAGIAANTPGAARVWFAHNHPSGVAEQSGADRQITARLHDLMLGTGIEPQGMIVVGRGGQTTHYHPSRAKDGADGVLSDRIKSAPRRDFVALTERRQGGGRPTGGGVQPDKLAAAFDRFAPGRDGVLLLNARNQAAGFMPLSVADMRKLRQGAGGASARLLAAFDETNAIGFALRVSGAYTDVISNMSAFGSAAQRHLIDVLDADGKPISGWSQLAAENRRATFYANPFYHALTETARDIGLNPGRSAAAAFAGGTAGGVSSDEEVGTPKWWLDVAGGAAGGVTLMQIARAGRLVGKGSIADNAYQRAGRYIESLPLIGRGPAEVRELKRKQRLMEQLIDRQVAEVGKVLQQRFTPAERGMMADLIETRGIVKDFNIIHRQAQALDDYLTHAAGQMKKLGMLPADMEVGGYLHRYYAKHLGFDKLFKSARRSQGLSGSYTIARGTDDVFEREFFSPGARQVLDELEQVNGELDKLKRKRGDMVDEDTAARLEALQERKRDLRGTEFVEYLGHQNKRLRSFLFAKDEVPRVPGDPVQALKAKSRMLETVPPSGVKAEDLTAPQVADLQPTERVWTPNGVKQGEVSLHRDWTKAERESWGEIGDAGYRYVRGMAEVSHDLSLATLFSKVASKGEWVRGDLGDIESVKADGHKWIKVPEGKVHKHSPLRKYGQLAGKHVRADVWAGIRNYGRAPFAAGPAGQVYRGALNKWKLWKTVYNPGTHLRNTWSNVEMYAMSGYAPRHLGTALNEMRRGEQSALYREARDAGLFGTDWTSSILSTSEGAGKKELEDIAEALRTQGSMPDAELMTSLMMDAKAWWIKSTNAVREAKSAGGTGLELARAVNAPLIRGLKFLKKPVDKVAQSSQRLYRFEDEVFKLGVFAAERKAGGSIDEAMNAANRYYFDYNDLPEAVKIARDFPIGSPFISYTYLALPAIARNVVQNPERVLALVAAFEAMNYASLTASDDEPGMGPGEYWATLEADAMASPPWERGRALYGALNTIHIPSPEGYRLALGNAHALGNPFMSEGGGREVIPTVPYATNFWGSSILGGNPAHALADVAFNEDWKGKRIYEPGDPQADKVKKSLAYLYQAWAPSNIITPGGYHQVRALEGLANDARKAREEGRDPGLAGSVVDAANGVSEALGMGQFTGLDRAENEILTRDALLSSFGVTIRPFRPEQSIDFEASRLRGEKQKSIDALRPVTRNLSEGRITERQFDKRAAQTEQQLEAVEAEEDELFDAEAMLRRQGRLR